MISKECKITVSGNTASIDSEIYLYKNDMNIKYLFNIVNGDYAYTKDSNLDNIINANKASYAQIKFKKEDIEIDFDVQETSNGKAILLIKKELIDEETELGDYTIQIRLFDESKSSVITLPPVNNCIHIMRPIFEKVDGSTNVVDEAAADEAIVTYAEPVASTNEDGTFAKKTWVPKEKITTAELNRMEEGISDVSSQCKEIAKQVGTETLNTTAQDLKGAINEVFQNVSNGKRLIASAITDKGVNTSDTATFQEMATNIGNISSTGGWSTQYSVTYKLSNVVSSNTSKSGNIGSSYTTTLTPNSGYKLNTPIITVDGIDVTSRYYLNGVFTINNVFGNIVITAHATKVITGEGLTLNYTFNNQTAGNGYGTISLLASSDDAAGTYAIQYADDNGALSNYDNICTLTVTNGVQADYNHFIKEQTIPKYATRLIAVKDNQTKAEFVIPESKRFTSGNYGRHLYSFGAISDLHTGVQTWDTDFQEALTYFNNKESALFTCITGDITDGGKAEQFQNYKNIKDTYSPNTPVYATNGNHEWNNSLFDDTLWDTYMNNKRTCLLTQGNDVFIMLGTGPKSNLITSEQKQWVELQLEKYSNCRVFILCHYFINGTDNGNYAKWDTDNVFSASNTHGQWLLGLLQQYKNAFYVSGHSHFKFILQELNPKANVCNEYNNNEIGYLWHLSSITIPRDVSNGSATGNLTAQSEGAVVDVYEKCILFRGRNFVDKKFLPIAQYIIPKIEGILPDINVYTVKTTMKNATSSNATTLVTKNSSYTTTITGTDGYSISKITVIMGMTDISSTAVSGNTITIESVTDDLFITVTTSAASSSEVITPTWMNGGVSSSGLDNDGDKDAMRSSYMEFDTTAYTYYITISDEFEGLDKVRLNVYNPDGSFNKRISYTSTSFTPGISGEIAFPITSGTFRFKVDFITSNTLENINDRLKITKVAK